MNPTEQAEYKRRLEAREARRREVEEAAGFHAEVGRRGWSRRAAALVHQIRQSDPDYLRHNRAWATRTKRSTPPWKGTAA